ncbi:MAG: deoxynucleoside kinase [Deltaproteobacteria bacterium]|nr:deoxynucleoside kinase [Deltaproteobacteria bacterium]
MQTRVKAPKNEVAAKAALTARAANTPVAPTPAPTAGKKAKLKPKYFLAMAGNIGAGKTTAAKLISQRLGFELFDEPVIDNRFLKDYYADMKRWSFTLQLEFLIRRVEHHELIHTVNKSCVQDRTLYEDPEIFAKYLHGLGFMTNSELDLYFEYFARLNSKLPKPDRIIAFDVPDVDVLLKRIRTRGRAEEKGIGKDFLRGLNGYYSSFSQVVQSKYGIPCLTVDVSEMDIRERPSRDEFLDQVNTFLRS